MKNRMLMRSVRTLLCVLLVLLTASVAYAAEKPLKGRTISVMGDSISTYMGWSDAYPITDESCKNRYGEPYYGPVGADVHNTDLTVEDTWWHQAAEQLGAEILMCNAGNSTGLLHASYPANADWDLYLKEMLVFKSRPYYMGRDGRQPDIIALYTGSNEVGKCSVGQFGSVEDVDFDQLIQKSGNGYTYAYPQTVAEAYCILLHKISVTYPQAEVYCFAVVPNAGGKMVNVTKRLAPCYPFNEMVRGVARHYGAHMVELLDEFQLDPDGDGVITPEALAAFQSYYHNDPHPNAAGFDVITRAFVKAVEENSRYIVEVETAAGRVESIETQVNASGSGSSTVITRSASDEVTPSGMIVNYGSTAQLEEGSEVTFSERYTSRNEDETYHAQGGRERSTQKIAPAVTLNVPLNTDGEASAASSASTAQVITGDPKTSWDDGIYDYTITQVKNSGSAAVKSSGVTVTDNASSAAYTNMKSVVSNTFGTETNGMVIPDQNVQRPTGPADAPSVPEGYDYAYIGSDQFSRYYAAFAYTEPQPKLPKETPSYSGNGLNLYVADNHATFKRLNLIIPRLYLQSGTVEEETIARWASLQQYTLADRSGNLVTAYCADQLTNTITGFGYNMHNLEDASYYDDADAEQIRTVVLNGYWGTESGAGSLTAVKDMMRQSGQFSEAEINRLNEGIAMTATQYAIWFSSNRAKKTLYLSSFYTETSDMVYPAMVADKDVNDLIFKLCFYLRDLEAENAPIQDTAHVLLNDKNFLKAVNVSLKGKPQVAANQDADDTNDVYTADLSFQLGVALAGNNGDDLVMTIADEAGNVVATGRLSGALQPGEVQLSASNGLYTFHDIPLTEGTQTIQFMLDGSQNLQRGVFLYLSQIVNGKESQPLVSLAEGSHTVDVDLALQFSLSASDDESRVEHVWRTEDFAKILPATGDPSHPAMLLALCLLSLAGTWIMLKRKKA